MGIKKISHNVSFEDLDEFVSAIKRMEEKKIKQFNFNGNVDENGNKNFNINWTSEEEV